jgi:hypothetical protein
MCYLCTLHGDRIGIRTTKWQLRVEVDTYVTAYRDLRSTYLISE